MKATAKAYSNIAFIKYWGKTDEYLRLPANSSVSMNLDSLYTTTTVEFSRNLKSDEITLDGTKLDNGPGRISTHLDRVRALAGIDTRARVSTQNNFPASTGLASSASGFAALTLAAAKAAELNLSEKELSILARLGSGSACRSIPAGFVEWSKGGSSESSHAVSLFGPDHWNIADAVAVVSRGAKTTGSTAGQKLAASSPFFRARLESVGKKIDNIKKYLAEKDFTAFGELLESEALELHAIALTSTPALIYWQPETLALIKLVQQWRNRGLECYFTIDAGPNVHIFTEGKNRDALVAKLKEIDGVENVIANRPGKGAESIDTHLF
ncbi:MAG: diphosphomevalonate decarboxylase [Candidatus Pacebacteria bacterium]|jgi:diphosphomevalonate decarboxylase|nr:diphosphomevalonate decarboxylase [Candidatus Paceibacterota bacterium]